jgi:hypothetical protein
MRRALFVGPLFEAYGLPAYLREFSSVQFP